MKKRIITVSREFASGGHTIAKLVADRLGIAFYDNKLITEVAKSSGLSEEFIKEHEEYASHSNSFLFQLAMSTAGSLGYPSVYQRLYEAHKHFAVDPDDRRRIRHRAAHGERGILVL